MSFLVQHMLKVTAAAPPPNITACVTVLIDGTCIGAGCDEKEVRCARWNIDDCDNAKHHIEVWESENGGSYYKKADNLNCTGQQGTGCALAGYDGSYGYQVAYCADTTTDNYKHKVQVRKDSTEDLLDECITTQQNISHKVCLEM